MSIDIPYLQNQFPNLTDIALLNSGGFKDVFSAIHPSYGHTVLKLFRPNQDIEEVKREILAVQQVQTTRVPKIFDYGQITTPLGTYYWFLEQQIIGATVRGCLQSGPFNVQQLLRLGLHSLEVLAEAEKIPIVHRDVKPENLICAHDNEFWVLDFGIARHLQLESLTPTVCQFGKWTPGYSPPEQFRNLKPAIDSRSDLFALGVTLFECATGQNPFRDGARDYLEIIKRVENIPLPQLNLSFSSSSEFRDLVASMTKKRPDQRPQTVSYALSWMQEICSKECI